MRYWLAAFTLLVPVVLAAQVVTIAEFQHSPFAWQEENGKEAKGWEVEQLRAMLEKAGFKPRFVFLPFPRVLAAMKNGDCDIGAAIVRSPDREKDLEFVSPPAFRLASELIVRQSSPLVQVRTLQDLAGLRIGFVVGQKVPRFMDVSGVYQLDTLSADDPANQNIAKLQAGRIDAILSLNRFAFQESFDRMGVANQVRFVGLPTEKTEFHFTVSPSSPLKARLHAVLRDSLASGKFPIVAASAPQ
jgi:ABC-type amino acid transport substrate-binding protein